MPWYSIHDAADLKQVTTRQIYRLISKGKLQSRGIDAGQEVFVEAPSHPGAKLLPAGQIDLPYISPNRITPEIIERVNAAMFVVTQLPGAVNAAEEQIQTSHGIGIGTLREWKTRLRSLFNLRPHTPLHSLAGHPQLRQALEYVIVPRVRSDRGNLRSAVGLQIAMPGTGQLVDFQRYIEAQYSFPNMSASDVYISLLGLLDAQRILRADNLPAALTDLPSERTVRAYLSRLRRDNVAVQRGRSRAHDWANLQEPYVTRDLDAYKPGEIWIGDHTELDFMVLDEDGKPRRRWITAFIDLKSRLLVGHCLDWTPSSDTIALAFRRGVTSAQLNARTAEGYSPVNIANVPVQVMLDNGKDYRSNYTQRSFGHIEFTDNARTAVQRIVNKLHYVTKYHGQSKAQQERWFGTIQSMLRHIPGYKGNQYQHKPDALKDELKSGAILTVAEFDGLIAAMIDAYNNRPHKSLGGQSPMQYYLANNACLRTVDFRVLDFLQMKSRDAKIQKCQIKMRGAEYLSEELKRHNDKWAEVYYDPANMGLITVYVAGEFAAVAVNKALIGVDERGMSKIVINRQRGERDMQSALKKLREPFQSERQAKDLAVAGRLKATVPVSPELLAKQVTTVGLITGLESDAQRIAAETDQAMQLVEIEERSKQKRKNQPLTLAQVSNLS